MVNQAFETVNVHKDRIVKLSTWVCPRKTNRDGEVIRTKARPVAKEINRVPDVDFGETFSSIS